MKTFVEDRRREAPALSRHGSLAAPPAPGAVALTDPSPAGDGSGSTARFVRHYVEMVVVMFAGMFVLMAPVGVLFSAFGTSWSELSGAMNVFAMALTMTVPMVAWMGYRGHGRRANAEMAASMLVPTFAVMAVLWAGAAKGSLMVPEHAGMLACMLAAMLLRREEYSCADHGRGRPVVA
jgi:hypothetical protein